MKMGLLGLGRMGLNMAKRLLRDGHEVVVWNRSPGPVSEAEAEGGHGASDPADLVGQLKAPRIAWTMLPAGDITGSMIGQLGDMLEPGDILIDGGNSRWKDTIARHDALAAKGIHMLDCGTSGGVWGLENGYCLMIGGPKQAYEAAKDLFVSLAPKNGYLHTGPSGSGHFTKMVHNGIEYGMLQAYGEGFEILKHSQYDLDLGAVAAVWNHGSVVRSWLLELAENAFGDDPRLDSVAGYVEDSGEGRWTIEAAMEEDVPAPVITASLYARFYSRRDETFTAKVIAALRKQFGGHSVRSAVPQEPPTGEEG